MTETEQNAPDSSASGIVIRVENLDKSFGDNHVLRRFSLTLNKGESIVVLGRSGSGKSVLIKCIIGLIKPDSGQVQVVGYDITDIRLKELDEVRSKVCFLFQGNALYDSMTVRENLEFPLRRHRKHMTREETDSLVKEALSNVGLPHTAEMMPSELSGGMRKRIALARTIILQPEIILYDEPTTGLDPVTAREISQLILRLGKKYRISSIVISHDMSCVRTVARKIVMLIDGKCYAEGTYEQLSHSADQNIRQFFNP